VLLVSTPSTENSCESTDHSEADTDTSSLVHVEPTAENADLYTMDLPEYTQQVAGGEISVDAESTRNEKQHNQDQSPAYDPLPSPEPQSLQEEHEYDIRPDVSDQDNPSHTRSSTPPALTHDFTEADATPSLASVRACSILHDRPAVWLVKRKSLALSPLAAAVLTKEGLLQLKDLHLYGVPSCNTGWLPLTPTTAYLNTQT